MALPVEVENAILKEALNEAAEELLQIDPVAGESAMLRWVTAAKAEVLRRAAANAARALSAHQGPVM